jgi:rare lipoprotein A
MTCLALLALGAAGCMRSPAPGPIGEPVMSNRYVVGVPYQISGRWYHPREDFDYDQTGLASFYGGEASGVNFHGRRTANGEIYDMNRMTAAHTTLPLPTIVRVTRLDNGRTVTVRVNDRGPFVEGRIIDLSRRSAQLLGMEGRGVAQVRVQVMADESRRLRDELLAGRPPSDISQLVQVASPGPADSGPITIATLLERQPAATAPATQIGPTATDAQVAALPATTPGVGPAQPTPTWNAAGQPVAAPPAGAPSRPQAPAPAGNVLPQAAVTTAPAAAIQPAATSAGAVYVQVGSFTSAENAERLRQRVQGQGRTHVSAIRVNGQNFYRVRIGPMRSNDEAAQLRQRIISVAPEARVVVD